MKSIITFISIVLMQTCNTPSQDLGQIYWVHSAKVDCVGVGPMTCLQVQKTENLDWSQPWELFYDKIEGFDYQPGYIYKLNILEEPVENPPADASSIKYTLIDILEKEQDKRYAIHDIYILEKIDGKTIVLNDGEKRPQIEINVTTMQLMGTNGCNSISGGIKTLNETEITFGPLMETRKMCQYMEIPNSFNVNLSKVTSYKREGTSLILKDVNNKALLSFKKID